MEGIKLDLTILESRLLAALSENEYESDINLLRVKLKELEGVVRNQDEVNRRIIEENVFFKSKLLFLEKLVLNMSQGYQNKGSGSGNPISIIEESPTRDSDQLSSLNKNSFSSSRNTNNSLSRDNELSANLTVNNIDLQQSIVSNTIDIDPRNSSFNVVGTRTPQEQNQIPLHVRQQATEVNTSNIDLSNLSQQLNDPNTNDIDLGNINESPSKQILVPSKQKKDTGTLVNRTSKPLKSQLEKEDNNTGKSTIPCPFLKRRGWCAKGRRCDFKHPRGEQKHLVPCPFLQNRGFA
ncbi:---NA--- [Paramuricea clavata]|uniref:---NA n=1 Tax=Paramuricea clavata TaxID=317549 RepID=A0A6S7I647_PARCT|nr:---NA--- [Paramuricea clavata]